MRQLGVLLILASSCTREPEPAVPQRAGPTSTEQTPTSAASVSASTSPPSTSKPRVGCDLSGYWTMKVTRKVPLASAPTNPSVCDKESFPDYTLEVAPYPASPEPFVRNLFPGETQQPTLIGETIDKGSYALLHNIGVLDLKEVAGTCEARVVLSAAQGHSLFDATFKIRVENGKIQGHGNWAWGTDLPEGVEECPPGGCTCSVDVDVTGAIVFRGART